MKIVRRVLGVAAWALLLLPFFFAAQGAHPATDDFTFAACTHATWEATGSLPHVIKDALSCTLRTWRDGQGAITGVLAMTLGPAVFTLEYYWVHAVILLALCLGAWFIFLRHVMTRRMGLKEAFLPVYLALTALLLTFLPDMAEGIYWFSGAWFCMGAQAIALLALTLCDRFAETALESGWKKAFAAACGVLLFLLGMSSSITAMMTAAALFMMALLRVYAGRREPYLAITGVQMDGEWQEHLHGGKDAAAHEFHAAKRTALLILPLLAGLLISVLAPGNAVHMAADGAHQTGLAYLGESVLGTLTAAAGCFLRFAVRTPMLIVLWALTPCICRSMQRVPVRKAYRTPPMLLTAIGAYLILCGMIMPHMYASGHADSGRVVNMYHCTVILASAIAWMLTLQRMKPETRGWLCAGAPRITTGVIALTALVLCLCSGQHENYLKLIRDQRDGTQDAYIAQYQNEYALCKAAGGEDDVFLPALHVQTLTGNPTASEDPAFWASESMAAYFGVKSVRIGEKPEEEAQVAPEAETAEEAAPDTAEAEAAEETAEAASE